MTDYKLMPKQITKEMADAFWEEYSKDRADDLLMRCYKALYVTALAPQPAEQQHHRDSAELRRLCQARDEQRDGRLAALERAAKAEADVAQLVEALERIASLPMNSCSTENDYRLSAAKAIAAGVLAAHRSQGGVQQ